MPTWGVAEECRRMARTASSIFRRNSCTQPSSTSNDVLAAPVQPGDLRDDPLKLGMAAQCREIGIGQQEVEVRVPEGQCSMQGLERFNLLVQHRVAARQIVHHRFAAGPEVCQPGVAG